MHILLYRGLKVFFRAIEKLELFFFERRELEFKNRETKKKVLPPFINNMPFFLDFPIIYN
jgi:hypothetical protein